jgi:integrase
VLSEDEMAVFDAALDEYERTAEQKSDVAVGDRCDALRLIAYVGLRKMVVLGARWSEFSDLDVDPIVWTVTVEPGRAKNGEKLVVSLAPEAADILRRIRVRRDQQGGWLREHQHVFPSRTAKGGHLLEIRQTFDNVVRLAGLEDKGLHLHDLRATWITAAVENGAKPEIVAAQVGHKNATVTLSVYNRIRASKEEKASVAGAAVSAYKRRVETAE